MKPNLSAIVLAVIVIGLGLSVIWIAVSKKSQELDQTVSEQASGTPPSHTEYLKSSLKVRPNAKYEGSYKFKALTPQALASQTAQSKLKSESNTGKDWDSLHCERWAVVTTINAPTTSVQKQAHVSSVDAKLVDGVHQGWCLLIVADANSPAEYVLDIPNNKYVYLSVERQNELAKSANPSQKALYQALPWGHVGRKNAGYLYAIRHGAKYIYDFDDDMLLLAKHHTILVPGEVLEHATRTISTTTTFTVRVPSLPYDAEVLNPFPLFDANHNPSWPRGFPSERILRNISTHDAPIELVQTQVPAASIGVVQYLANHDPDVDSLYRLVRPLPLDFPLHGVVPLILPPQRAAPAVSVTQEGRRQLEETAVSGGAAVKSSTGASTGTGTGTSTASSGASTVDNKSTSAAAPSGVASTSTTSTTTATAATTTATTAAPLPGTTTTPTTIASAPTTPVARPSRPAGPSPASLAASAIAPPAHTVYAPFNSQSTLHTSSALFALLLPLTSHPRVSDIWRSFIAQRIFSEIGVRVAFHSPISAHIRTPKESDLPDMLSELPLYADSLAFIKLLRSYVGSSTTVPGRLEELYVHLYEQGFVGVEDVALVQKWLAALIECGYEFPALVK